MTLIGTHYHSHSGLPNQADSLDKTTDFDRILLDESIYMRSVAALNVENWPVLDMWSPSPRFTQLHQYFRQDGYNPLVTSSYLRVTLVILDQPVIIEFKYSAATLAVTIFLKQERLIGASEQAMAIKLLQKKLKKRFKVPVELAVSL